MQQTEDKLGLHIFKDRCHNALTLLIFVLNKFRDGHAALAIKNRCEQRMQTVR